MRKGLFHTYAATIPILSRVFDIILVFASGLLAYWFRFGFVAIHSDYLSVLFLAAFLTFTIFPFFHIYESHRIERTFLQLRQLFFAVAMILMILVVLSALLKVTANFSRVWLGTWLLGAILLLALSRCVLYVLLRIARRYGWNQRYVVIIGGDRLAESLMRMVIQEKWLGYQVVCFIGDQSLPSMNGVPFKPLTQNLMQTLQGITYDEIWIAIPLFQEEAISKILHELRHNTAIIRLILDTSSSNLFRYPLTNLLNFPALNIRTTPMEGINYWLKMIEDYVVASVILVLISPLLLLIALLVKCSSPGPILFRQKRHGWDGKEIIVYKFRSMKLHEEKEGEISQATKRDSRITSIGRFLRRTSLDELPQFINVLQGRMSVVGPRPHPLAVNNHFLERIDHFMLRHRVKPGITGWAQVNGFRGETDTLEKMRKRIEYDLYYIEHWSLWLDLKIIFLTIFKGFIGKNAY
jgi:putative colanic acid biosynthesis UDP-glucose lipid carrier transferase